MITLDFAFIVQVVNFLILLLVLNIFLYKPIRKILTDRAAELTSAKEKAATVEQEVQERMASYEARLREVKAQAGADRGTLKKEALEAEAAILDKARKESTESLATIKNQIAKEAAHAKAVLQEQARGLSIEICEKVLGRSL